LLREPKMLSISKTRVQKALQKASHPENPEKFLTYRKRKDIWS
jgi:hypothetical protein